MRLLITGAGGFLGSHLTDAALKHWRGEIVALCNYHGSWNVGDCPIHERVKIERLDIRDTQAVANLSPDLIINAAARISVPYSNQMPTEYADTNAAAVQRLLASLPRARFIQISTSEVFNGRNPPYFPDAEVSPATPYGASKAAAEMYVRAAGQTIVRCFNLFGPRQTPRAVIPRMALAAWRYKRGETDKVRELYGPHNAEGVAYSRAFIYAPDVADLILRKAVDDPRPLIQLSCGSPYKIAALWSNICAVVGIDPIDSIEWQPLPDNATAVWRLYGVSTEGYKPRDLDQQTLAETVEWYGANAAKYPKGRYD